MFRFFSSSFSFFEARVFNSFYVFLIGPTLKSLSRHTFPSRFCWNETPPFIFFFNFPASFRSHFCRWFSTDESKSIFRSVLSLSHFLFLSSVFSWSQKATEGANKLLSHCEIFLNLFSILKKEEAETDLSERDGMKKERDRKKEGTRGRKKTKQDERKSLSRASSLTMAHSNPGFFCSAFHVSSFFLYMSYPSISTYLLFQCLPFSSLSLILLSLSLYCIFDSFNISIGVYAYRCK